MEPEKQKVDESMPQGATKDVKPPRRCLLNSALYPLIATVFFGIAYAMAFAMIDPMASDIKNSRVLEIFQNYGKFFVFVFALLSLILAYALFGLKWLFRLGRIHFVNPLFAFLAFLPWLILGYQLVYHEPRYTDIARGLISYAGQPLLYAGETMLALCGVWLIVAIIFFVKNKNK